MTNPTTQRRLMALLTGALYAIANALFPVVNTVMQQPTRPWLQRANYADRFSRIIQKLIALAARIRPETLSRNPTFQTNPQQPARPTPAALPKQPGPLRPLAPLRPARPLSPLQFAQRLAKLLRQLEQLAAELRTALPATILRNAARARAIAGCHALPSPADPTATPNRTWERAG